MDELSNGTTANTTQTAEHNGGKMKMMTHNELKKREELFTESRVHHAAIVHEDMLIYSSLLEC